MNQFGPWKVNAPVVGRVVTKIVEGATGFFNGGSTWKAAPVVGPHDPAPKEAYDEDCGCGEDPFPPDEPEDRFYDPVEEDALLDMLRDTVHDLELAEAQRDAFGLALVLLDEDYRELLRDNERLEELYEVDRRAWVRAVEEAIRERNELARTILSVG